MDAADNLYFISHDGSVLRLAAGSSVPTTLWHAHTSFSDCVKVDTAGNVYFTERLSEGTSRVLKLSLQE